MDTPRIVTFDDLKPLGVLLGRRRVDQLEAEGKFPKRVTIGTWRVGWVADEVRAWVDAKIEARHDELGAIGSGRGRKRN